MNIKKIDEQIAEHQKRIDSLNAHKAAMQRMSALVETLSSGERVALYEILQEMHDEGEL